MDALSYEDMTPAQRERVTTFLQFIQLLREAHYNIGPMSYGVLRTFILPELLGSLSSDLRLLQHNDIAWEPTVFFCVSWSNFAAFQGPYCSICHFAIWEPTQCRQTPAGTRCHRRCRFWVSDSERAQRHRENVVRRIALWLNCPAPLVPELPADVETGAAHFDWFGEDHFHDHSAQDHSSTDESEEGLTSPAYTSSDFTYDTITPDSSVAAASDADMSEWENQDLLPSGYTPSLSSEGSYEEHL